MKLPLPRFLTEPTGPTGAEQPIWVDVFIVLAVLTVGFLWRAV